MKISMQNRFTRLIPVLVLVTLAVLFIGAPVSAALVSPEFVPQTGPVKDPTTECENVTGNTNVIGAKLENLTGTAIVGRPGWYSYTIHAGFFDITVEGNNSSFGSVTVFDWYTSGGVGIDYVLAKAGNENSGGGWNVYDYTGISPEPSSDTGLVFPDGKSLSHITFCFDVELTVQKTANPVWEVTYTWTIDKAVAPDATETEDNPIYLFAGDSQAFDYTVTATRTEVENASLSGTITVINTTPYDGVVFTLTDSIPAAVVDCPTYTFDSGQSVACTWSIPDAEAGDYDGVTNIATAHATTPSSGIGDGVGEALIDWPDEPTETDASEGATATITDVAVEDDPDGWAGTGTPPNNSPAADNVPVNYSETYTCSNDPLDYTDGSYFEDRTNTATLTTSRNVVKQDAEAAHVICYIPSITKTAPATFTRAYNWNITKSSTTTSLQLPPGGISPSVSYTVTAGLENPAYTDANFAVSGTITVTNPAPVPAHITNVADVIEGVGSVTVDCGTTPPYTIAAEDSLDCTYSSALPNADARTNTATATLQNYDHGADGTSTPSGTSDFTHTVNVTFGAPALIDECITVSDSKVGPLNGGLQVCFNQAPKTFTYTTTWTVPVDAVCGQTIQFTNTASFETVDDDNDTDQSDSSSYSIPVTVSCGCTLTQGYWKTHSEIGPAPYDDTWALLSNGASTTFYLSGQTYHQVLQTAPQGNVYYILAQQYIAAQLNILNGAPSAPISSVMTSAEAFFNTYTPATALTITKAQRNTAIGWASTLDNYNNGRARSGAVHCSE